MQLTSLRAAADGESWPPMRILMPLFVLMALAGCQYDPHAHLYTTSEPKTEDLVGTYVFDKLHLPPHVGSSRPTIQVVLHADGTFAATNVPPANLSIPNENFFASLITTSGKWKLAKIGSLDPGRRAIWGVQMGPPGFGADSAAFTGDKPPYGLIFTIGDPDSGHAVLLRREQ